MVCHEKSAVVRITVPLKITCCFSMSFFSLSLALGFDYDISGFKYFLFGVYLPSWICRFKSFAKFEKSSVIFLLSFCWLLEPMTAALIFPTDPWDSVHIFPNLLFSVVFLLHTFFWSIVKFTDFFLCHLYSIQYNQRNFYFGYSFLNSNIYIWVFSIYSIYLLKLSILPFISGMPALTSWNIFVIDILVFVR